MRSAADIASEMDEGLGLLFQRGLELALQVQADALEAEAPASRAKLAIAFHRLSRSVRQTAALRIRIAREAERAGREQEAQIVRLDDVRRRRRKAHLKGAVEALVWTEYEPLDADGEAIVERLDAVLDGEAETEDFLGRDPDAQFQALCAAIGFDPPLLGEVSPKATEGADAHAPFPPQSLRDSSLSGEHRATPGVPRPDLLQPIRHGRARPGHP